MPANDVQRIIGRAATDSQFRQDLLTNAQTALADYDLTEEEKGILTNLDNEKLMVFSKSLDSRITKGFSNIN